MDAFLVKHIFRNINSLTVRNVLRNFSTTTTYQHSLLERNFITQHHLKPPSHIFCKQPQSGIVPSSPILLSLSSLRIADIPAISKELNLRLYSTSNVLREESTDGKLQRPDEMNFRRTTIPGEGKGPVTWINLAVTGVIVLILLAAYYYARTKKEAMLDKERKREIGKSKIGGTFDLIDQDGNAKTSADFYGKWVLLYFGFTHCPDVCPDEMEKIAEVYDKLQAKKKSGNIGDVIPIMISVDPERDGVKEMKEYCKEFHPDFVGLTGSVEKVTEACKAFRVYFSAGPRSDDDDYIVDHTIIVYLLDPEGQFIDYYGQTKTADQVVAGVQVQMAKKIANTSKSLSFPFLKSS